MMISAHFMFGQRLLRDHTYSSANYKHPNKAAYARLHNLDNAVTLNTSVVKRNDNYKQPGSTKQVTAAVLPRAKENKIRASYKHPNGL